VAGPYEYGNDPLSTIKCGELLDKQRNCQFLQNDQCLGVRYFPPHRKHFFSITTTNWSKLRGDDCFNMRLIRETEVQCGPNAERGMIKQAVSNITVVM
jgi:hypothetical protein